MASVSKAQQHFFGMKYAQAKKSKSGKAKMNGSTMTTSQLKDFAATKTAKLPMHVKPKKKAAPAFEPRVKTPGPDGRY